MKLKKYIMKLGKMTLIFISATFIFNSISIQAQQNITFSSSETETNIENNNEINNEINNENLNKPQPPSIYAEGAILMDAKTGNILYEKNSKTKYYPASITKLMTALLTVENLKPDDRLTFSKDAIYGIEFGSSHIGMKIGEEISVDEAIHGLMLDSANEVANGLAERISGSIDQFAIHMTNRAKELGTLNTNFKNPHGLHDDEHYTTAYDMALIVKELYKNPYFLEVMSHDTYQIPPNAVCEDTHYLSQQHRLMNEIRYRNSHREDVIAGKTGFTNEARNTLVTVASHNGIDLIVVLLKGDKKTYYDDTEKLLDFGYENYRDISTPQTRKMPNSPFEILPVYTVRSGLLKEMGIAELSLEGDTSVYVDKDIKKDQVEEEIVLPEFLEPHVKEGDLIGQILYRVEDQVINEKDIVISNIIEP